MEPIKLDYSLKTAEERAEFVKNLPKEQLKNKKYLEILADYITFAMTKEEKKRKEIITNNRMVTINKRETSYQGLVSKFENGEDGLYNFIIDDKNVLLTPKVSITERDVAEIPALKDLRDSIAAVEGMEKAATGRRRYQLKKQLIEMHQEQYTIKNSSRTTPSQSTNTSGRGYVQGFSKLDLGEHIWIDEDGEPQSDCLINLFDPNHMSAVLCNYSALKGDAWGRFTSDLYYMMEDIDDLVEETLKDEYPLYYKLLIYKIDGKQNVEIQELLDKEFNVKHSIEYISSLWRNKIPRLLADAAKEKYLNWHFTMKEKGQWKTCSHCGQTKLATNRFFSKNSTSKDGWYSICKKCRNEKSAEARRLEKGE